MSDLQSPEPSSLPGATPPPLPHKVILFKLACRLGLGFGIVQTACLLLMFVLYRLTPGGPPPLAVLLATVGAALEAFSAYLISKHRPGGRGLFTVGTVCVSFGYLMLGGFIFAILNLIPLLLLVASSSPDVAPKVQEGKSFEASSDPSSGSSASKEDLY